MADTVATATTLRFGVNGRIVDVPSKDYDPSTTLLSFLRETLGLPGTKVGCGEGGCGACTVILSRRFLDDIHHRSVAACLLPLGYLHGMHVTTIEGASQSAVVQDVQERLVETHSVQCGYCTPGIVMSLSALLCQKTGAACAKGPAVADIEECLDGNLCRCTGYRPIVEAAQSLHGRPPGDGQTDADGALWQPQWPSGLDAKPTQLLCFSDGQTTWYRPTSLDQLLSVVARVASEDASLVAGLSSLVKPAWQPQRSTATMLAGNTDVGYERRYHPERAITTYISVLGVAELHQHRFDERALFVGAAVTIHGLASILKKGRPAEVDPGFRAIAMQLRFFANKQVRDMGTIGGSVVAADPISDLYPPLNALDAVVLTASAGGERRRVPSSQFKLLPGEVMLGVEIPYSRARHVCVESYKQAKRRLDSQALLNAAFYLAFDDSDKHVVRTARIAMGGCSKVAGQRFARSESALQGRSLLDPLVHDDVLRCLHAEAEQLMDKSRGSSQYRLALVASFWHKFWLSALAARCPHLLSPLDRSAVARYTLSERRSSVSYTSALSVNDADGSAEQQQRRPPIGLPLTHRAAKICADGSAKFLDDHAPPAGTLHGAVVLSSRARAALLGVDASAAGQQLGDELVAVVTAADVPHSNLLGSIAQDEPVFADGEVLWHGQLVAVCLARTRSAAQRAARLVDVRYGESLPFVHSIDDAIAQRSYLCPPRVLERRDRDGRSAAELLDRHSDDLLLVEGRVVSNGQDHFYIELPAAQVLIEESSPRVDVRCTSQNPSMVQRAVASVLGLPYRQVNVRVDRIGGGFGGKQDRPSFLAAAAAVCARKTGAPVRLVLEREEDMCYMGKRHPFQSHYRVLVDRASRQLRAVHVDMYANGGYTLDLTDNTVQVAMATFDSCYALASPTVAVRVVGHSCRTNRPSNTAFRGFGKPEATVVIESIVERVALALGVPAVDLRQQLFVDTAVAPTTIFGQRLADVERARACWFELRRRADFDARLAAVERFNQANRWRKRGIAMVPSKSNIGFEEPWMNQSAALVHVYRDGSIVVSHGGVEMGQGLHTKMAAIVVAELGRLHPTAAPSLDDVVVAGTQTSLVPNTNPTAAVTGTELNGRACRDACRQLVARLQPMVVAAATGENNDAAPLTWPQLVEAAYREHVLLSAVGHGSLKKRFRTYHWDDGHGDTCYYFIWAASCSEVELDVLTGSYRVLQTDIVHDCGRSSALNPAIDVGQIEGGFAQGLGLFTLEDQVWAARDGHLRTRNVSTYKIPSHDDMPVVWNIHLLPPDETPVAAGSAEDRPLYSAKTAGESGIQLAYSVVAALRQAIFAARPFDQSAADLPFTHPLTVDRIRALCPPVPHVDDRPRGSL